MANQSLLPVEITRLQNFTPNNVAYLQDDPYSPDANNLSPIDGSLPPLIELKFESPTHPFTGTQTINVKFMDNNWVGLQVIVRENGVEKYKSPASYNGYGTVVAVFTWDANVLTDKTGKNVTIELLGSNYNGLTMQTLNAVRWEATVDETQPPIGGGEPEPPPESIWNELTPLPAPRQRGTGQWFHDKFYYFGGFDSAGALTATTYIYDPWTNEWTTGAPHPNGGFRNAGSVVIGNAIYLVGGLFGTGYSDRILRYYPDTNRWDSTQTILPFTVGRSVTEAVNGWIYILSGYINDAESRECWRINPNTLVIQRLADKPTASVYTDHALVVGVEPELYVVAGYSSATYAQRQLEIYNPVKDTWRTGTQFPTTRWAHTVEYVEGKIYAFGGTKWNNNLMRDEPSKETYEFSFETFSWKLVDPLPKFLHHHTSGVYNGDPYIVGGADDRGTATDRFFVWNAHQSVPVTIPITISATMTSASWIHQLRNIAGTNGEVHVVSTVTADIGLEKQITIQSETVSRVDMQLSVDRQVTPQPVENESRTEADVQRRTEITLRTDTTSTATAGIMEVDAIYSRVDVVSSATMDILVMGTRFIEPIPLDIESRVTADMRVHRIVEGRSEAGSETGMSVGIHRIADGLSETESRVEGIATATKGITATSDTESRMELFTLPLIKETGRLNVIVRSDVTAWMEKAFEISGNVYVNGDVFAQIAIEKGIIGTSNTESVVNDLYIPMVKSIFSTVDVVSRARADTYSERQIMVDGTAHGTTTANADIHVQRWTMGRSESFGEAETTFGVDRGTFVGVDIVTETDMVLEKAVVLQPEIIMTESEVHMTAYKTISVTGDVFIESSAETTAEREISISSTIENESVVYLDNMEKIGWTFGAVNVESTARMNVETLGEVFIRLTSRNESDISLETVKVDRILDGMSDTQSEVRMTPYKTISVNLESFIESHVETSLSRDIPFYATVPNHSEVQPLPVEKIGWTFGRIDMESTVDLNEAVQIERIIQGTSDIRSDMTLESLQKDIPVNGFSDVSSDVRGNVFRNIPIDGHISVESSSVLHVLIFGSSEIGMVVSVKSTASSELTILRETFIELDIVSDATTQTRVDRWINGTADIESDMSLVLGNLLPIDLAPVHVLSTVYMQEPIDTYLEAENALYEGVSADDDGKLLSYTIDSGVGRHIEFIFEFKIDPVGLQQLEFQVQGTAGQPFRLQPYNIITTEWDWGTVARYDGIVDQEVTSLIIKNAEPFMDTENKIRFRMISTNSFTSGELTLSTDYAELLKTYLVMR